MTRWPTPQLRRLIESLCDGPFGSSLKSSHYTDAGVPVVRLQNIQPSGYNLDAKAFISEDYFEELDGHEAHPGDLLVAGLGDGSHPVGRACVLPDEISVALVKADCFRVRLASSAAHHPFVAYWMNSNVGIAELASRAKGTTRSRISLEAIRELRVPIPPFPTQRRIADFLDRKTAAIDALIAKKERLLALLAEKRAALIHRAVTKGLDPSVPMKDSGVPWIGEVPEHWEVKRLKHATRFVTSGPRGWGQYYAEEGPLFLRITNVARDDIELLLEPEKRQSVAPPAGAEGVRTSVRAGDLLISITADLGSVGVVPSGLGRAFVSQHVALCRPSGEVAPRLLAYIAGSAWGRAHFDLSMNGGTKVGLNLDDVRNMPICVPPAMEQAHIVNALDTANGRSASCSEKTLTQLDRLREYRQALITAAVTGQLDLSTADTDLPLAAESGPTDYGATP